MPSLKKHLRVAIRHLKLEHAALEQALDHPISEEYGEPWVEAIEKAVKTNLKATTHVQNILASIRLLDEPSYGVELGIIRPRRR